MITFCTVAFVLIVVVVCPFVMGQDERLTKLHNESSGVAIKMYTTSWTAAWLNSHIAAQLIESHFPNTTVTLVPVNGEREAILEMLGDPNSPSVVLEAWPTYTDNVIRNAISFGTVEILGDLGVIGQVGWYVPDYVAREYPQSTSYQFYQDEESARLFSTAETEPNGHFTAGDPGWSNGLDEAILSNLNMPFTVVYTGSEEGLKTALSEASQDETPMIMHYWVPTATASYYNLQKVQLPPITEQCRTLLNGDTHLYDCDYPEEQLYKFATVSLRTKAPPDLYNFFRAFTLTTDDQMKMLPLVELENRTYESVAAEWIAGHQDVWEEWLLGEPTTTENEPNSSSLSLNFGMSQILLLSGLVAYLGVM